MIETLFLHKIVVYEILLKEKITNRTKEINTIFQIDSKYPTY